jgi:hypothetical protein
LVFFFSLNVALSIYILLPFVSALKSIALELKFSLFSQKLLAYVFHINLGI